MQSALAVFLFFAVGSAFAIVGDPPSCQPGGTDGASCGLNDEAMLMQTNLHGATKQENDDDDSAPKSDVILAETAVGGKDASDDTLYAHELLGIRFNAAGHRAAGNAAWADYIAKAQERLSSHGLWTSTMSRLFTSFSDRPNYINNREHITYGDYVSLSGDFYGDENRKTDNTQTNLATGVNQLNSALASQVNCGICPANDPWGLVRMIRGLNTDAAKHTVPSQIPSSKVEFAARNAKFIAYRGLAYKTLAFKNFDHFGAVGRLEFENGQNLARSEAWNAGNVHRNGGARRRCNTNTGGTCSWTSCNSNRFATCTGRRRWTLHCLCNGNSNQGTLGNGVSSCNYGGQCQADPQSWFGKLTRAFELSAFGTHFLTDQYAPGHTRVPYSGSVSLKQKCPHSFNMYGVMPTPYGGFLTKQMHDEDNKNGLWGVNALGESWFMMGDGYYFVTPAATNRRIMQIAVQRGLNDIVESFIAGTRGQAIPAYPSGDADPKSYVMDETKSLPYQFPPLFRKQGSAVEGRISPRTQTAAQYKQVEQNCNGVPNCITCENMRPVAEQANAASAPPDVVPAKTVLQR